MGTLGVSKIQDHELLATHHPLFTCLPTKITLQIDEHIIHFYNPKCQFACKERWAVPSTKGLRYCFRIDTNSGFKKRYRSTGIYHSTFFKYSVFLVFCYHLAVKGGESSSRFQWFTIDKIELYFLLQFWDCGCKDIHQIKKDVPRKNFLETLSFVLPAKTTVGLIV